VTAGEAAPGRDPMPPRRGTKRTLLSGSRRDEGNASVEFLGIALVLLVPLVYLVLLVGRLEAASFAVEGAARESARVAAAADTAELGRARALEATTIALADQRFDDDPSQALTLTCSSQPCLAPASEVEARVTVRVPLPFVPGFVRSVVPLSVTVSADRVAPVDVYRASR
jgi:Na+-transporting methylmalonyl-CoA/oxaloacetate decarboxylase gamma subunit